MKETAVKEVVRYMVPDIDEFSDMMARKIVLQIRDELDADRSLSEKEAKRFLDIKDNALWIRLKYRSNDHLPYQQLSPRSFKYAKKKLVEWRDRNPNLCEQPRRRKGRKHDVRNS